MKVGIEANRLGRGGASILEALIEALLNDVRVDEITVFGNGVPGPRCHVVPGPTTRLAALRWAVSGWAKTAERFDRALSFTGFAQAAGQTSFVHNALYYDPAAALLPVGAQARLAVLRELTADTAQSAQTVIVQSPWMQAALEADCGVRAHVVSTIPRAVQATSLWERQVDLLWVGNEVAFKDHALAIAAATRLRRHLTLIGNTRPMANGPFHTWVGELPRDVVYGYYRRARVLIMTSRAESLGLPLAEAMQCGLPVVSVDLPYARALCGDQAVYFDDLSGLCAALAGPMHRPSLQFDSDAAFEQFARVVVG
ncbi:MAG: glycosyltransferase [bacterium]